MRTTLLSALLLALVSTTQAAPDVRDANWASLTTEERSVLAPLQGGWETMEPETRLKWREMARRFPDMPASRQERVRERMRDWATMTPQQRIQARQTFTGTKSLSREERRAQWEAYQALSPEERAALGRPGPSPNRAVAPGASTRLVGTPAEAPPHLQNSRPINVMPRMVDRTTLLPLRGPQGAAQVKPVEPNAAGASKKQAPQPTP